MKRFNKIKKIIATIMSFALLICCFNTNVLAAETKEYGKEGKFEVYNGYGELLYTADSIEEAEAYLETQGAKTRASSGAYLIGKLTLKEVVKKIGIVTAICVAYRVGDYLFGDGELIDIANEIVPISTLLEIAELGQSLRLYSTTTSLTNPYPPNSYQGSQWVKSTFYYVVEK